MDDLKYFQERMDQQDKKLACLEKKMDETNKKVDILIEQMSLGKHLVMLAKAVGWLMGVMATALAVYRAWKGQ
jgi:hypothetical protein